MKGNPEVIERLNTYLQIELTGHKQYLLASAMLSNWGFHALAQTQLEYSREETQHAARIMARVLFLEGEPATADAGIVTPLANVEEQIRADVELVQRAIDHLQESVAHARGASDNASRELFEEMLVDEEQHLDWLETQLSLIADVGVHRYLQQQMG